MKDWSGSCQRLPSKPRSLRPVASARPRKSSRSKNGSVTALPSSFINLTKWMKEDGKAVTDPFFDLDDFLGLADATGLKERGFDGSLWQLPDQSFINVYWFRADWFERADLKEKFKAKYGYDLGVPVNWSA